MKKKGSVLFALEIFVVLMLILIAPKTIFAGRSDSCSSSYSHTFNPSPVLFDTEKIEIGVDGPLQNGSEYYIELESLSCSPERSTNRVLYTGNPMMFTIDNKGSDFCIFVGGEVTYRLRRRNPGPTADVDICILGRYNPVLSDQIAASCRIEISPSPASVSMPITVTGKDIKNSAGALISSGRVAINRIQTGTIGGDSFVKYVDVSNGQFAPINIGTFPIPGSWTVYMESYAFGKPNICSEQIQIHEFIDPNKPLPEPVGLQPYDPRCNPGDPNSPVKSGLGCLPVDPQVFVNKALPWAIGIGSGIAFLLGLYGALMIVISAGDPEKMQAGKEIITSAIAGLLLIVFAVFILRVIGVNILGLFGFPTEDVDFGGRR